jgi:hypothetical protein
VVAGRNSQGALRVKVSTAVPESISPDVRSFVAERIHSVAQLELLLILHRDPSVQWTAESAGREMRFPSEWVAEQLAGFHRAGLVGWMGTDQRTYRYRPRPGLDRIVDELAQTFSRRRNTVTGLIYSRAEKDMQSFSDAFLLRPTDE